MAVMHSKGTEALIEAIGDAANALNTALNIMAERKLESPKRQAQVQQLYHDAEALYDDLIERGLVDTNRSDALGAVTIPEE